MDMIEELFQLHFWEAVFFSLSFEVNIGVP